MEAPPPYSESASAPSIRLSTQGDTSRVNLEEDTVTFVDFVPPGSPDGTTYPAFGWLIEMANDWLEGAPGCEVVTCEVIRLVLDDRGQLRGLAYKQEGQKPLRYLHGLRLWLRGRSPASEQRNVIGCLTLVPDSKSVTRKGQTGLQFEHLSEMLERLKTQMELHPLPGAIISVDSRKSYAPNIQRFEADSTHFIEEGTYQKHYVTVLRVFYLQGVPLHESIEVVDFYPWSKFRMFSEVAREGAEHLSGRALASLSAFSDNSPDLRLTNIQTLEVEVKSGKKVDTSRMKVSEENEGTEHVRFLRAFSVKGLPSGPLSPDSSSKTFLPLWVSGQVESLEKTKERIESWLKATGAKVLCAETVELRSPVGEEPQLRTDIQATNCYQWLTAFRLYLDGSYPEPDASILPAMPRQSSQSKNNCNIS